MAKMSITELTKSLSQLGKTARELLESPDLDLYLTRQTSKNYETELIQVAASAIAALVDLRLEKEASETDVQKMIELEIHRERVRQDQKFGPMPRKLDPLIWVAILLEELAEVSEEVVS